MEWVTVGANGQFNFGQFLSTLQVPITPSVMLLVRGGGGNGVGVEFGDIGARVLVHGDGGPGTVALTSYFGGAGITFDSCAPSPTFGESCERTSIGGPAIGGGVEYRR
jgi:hypothetical protein